MIKPIIYLDIDGVLLANENNLALGAEDFIAYISGSFEVYWLTTHCMDGDSSLAIKNVNAASDKDLSPYLSKFLPTQWQHKKTEAINFDRRFLWFDDDLYTNERIDLNRHGVIENWVEIDLAKYPDQLVHELSRLKKL